MTPEEWEKVSDIYSNALELDDVERIAYLARACEGDSTIRAEVESLLNANANAGDFITEPIVGGPLGDDGGEPIVPGDMVGPFVIESKLGSGGMGEVFLAIDTRLDRQVALKTLPSIYDNDPAFQKRFQMEARAAANLNHPNVATIHSVELHEGKRFIAMEYIDGTTLDHEFDPQGMELRTFLRWFTQIADALQHAHSKGVIHRDIKPGNLMITRDGVSKVLDFGLARIEEHRTVGGNSLSDITQPGQVIGTPSYMSPEQAEGMEVDARSDIFSLGVVMYEALCGKRPFLGESYGDIVRNLVARDPESIASLRPDVPLALATMIEKCLAKSPSARLASMAEVRSILDAVRSRSLSPPSVDSFVRRFYREAGGPSRLWLAAASVLVVVLAIGGWYYFSRPTASPPFTVDRVSIRKLSQSNEVALSVIAPDGRSVAYVTYDTDGGRSLWFRRVNDTNSILVVPSQQVHFWDIGFSNDSEHLYYITAPRFGTHGTLYRVSALGGQPRKVKDAVNHLGNLSPDGKRFLFVRYGEAAPESTVNVKDSKLISANSEDGSDERIHKVLTGESLIRKARYSSDGNTIYYIRRELDGSEYWSIMALDILSESEREIIRQKERIDALAPLRDKKGLLISAVDPVSNRLQLFHVSIATGETARVTNDLNSYIGVSVDAEGRHIVSAQRTHESRVWIGEAEDMKTMVPVTREPLAHEVVDWTPDDRIVFDARENNRLSIWIADADGRNAMQLTPQDSDNSGPRVSGDGRYIVFTSKRGGYNQIWRMNIDGSNPILIADVPGVAQTPRFAADGTTVVFRWYHEGSPPMGQVSVDGGPVTGLNYLPMAFTYYWDMSPDGKHVAYTSGGNSADPMRVVVRPVDSETPKTFLEIRPAWIFKWMHNSREIFYQEAQQGEAPATKVLQIDPNDPKPKLLLSTEPDNILDLTFSRDGKRFAAVRLKIVTDAIMLSAAELGSPRPRS